VLAVGDAEFQKKCLGKMNDVSKGEGRTVLFVSHNMGIVKNLCPLAILLQNGLLYSSGNTDQVTGIYSMLSAQPADSNYLLSEEKNIDAYFTKISLFDSEGNVKNEFDHNESIFVRYSLTINKKNEAFKVFLTILDHNQMPVCSSESDFLSEKIEVEIPGNFLTRGYYSIQTFIHIPMQYYVDRIQSTCYFKVTDAGSYLAIYDTYNYGSIFGNFNWLK
jgi:lipopolysaccharide transport system ATP-binding protein